MEKNQRFKFIDGLRGIAALSVVLFHLHIALQKHVEKALPYFFEQFFFLGYLGIQIFFVLSGFVIAYSLQEPKIDFLRFFLRRSIRLDPPYWTTILITLALAAVAHMTFKVGEDFPFSSLQVFYNLIYLPDLLQVPLIIPVAWTLCIEFQFYLVFALLLILFQRFKMKGTFFLTALALFSLLQSTPLQVLPFKPVTFIPHWYSFYLGCATCWAMVGKMDKKILWFNYFILTVCSFWTTTPHAWASLATALLIHGVAESGKLSQVLHQEFFQYMGKISYSLYLIHWTIGMKLVDIGYRLLASYEKTLISPLLLLTSLFLTIFIADLFYRLIERPSHQLSRQINETYKKTSLQNLGFDGVSKDV